MFYETMEDILPDLKVIITDGDTQTMLPLESFTGNTSEDASDASGNASGTTAGSSAGSGSNAETSGNQAAEASED